MRSVQARPPLKPTERFYWRLFHKWRPSHCQWDDDEGAEGPQSSRMLCYAPVLMATNISKEFPLPSTLNLPGFDAHEIWTTENEGKMMIICVMLQENMQVWTPIFCASLLILFQHEQYFTKFCSYNVKCLQFCAVQHLIDKAQATHRYLPLCAQYLW